MKTALLDTSFLIDLADESAADVEGPAHRALVRLKGCRIYISAVTVAEVLEGAEDQGAAAAALSAYHFQTLGWGTARRCALAQSRSGRRMGENDAWQAALAVASGHCLVAHDHAFGGRPWLDYLDYRGSV
jgi:predicted nucleic acid-binding protein